MRFWTNITMKKWPLTFKPPLPSPRNRRSKHQCKAWKSHHSRSQKAPRQTQMPHLCNWWCPQHPTRTAQKNTPSTRRLPQEPQPHPHWASRAHEHDKNARSWGYFYPHHQLGRIQTSLARASQRVHLQPTRQGKTTTSHLHPWSNWSNPKNLQWQPQSHQKPLPQQHGRSRSNENQKRRPPPSQPSIQPAPLETK